MGGLGLIKLSDFITAQQTMWIKRASLSTRDNWRIDLTLLGHGNIFTINPADISRTEHPILHGLVNSFFLFVEYFSVQKNNFEHSFILNNHIFERGLKDKCILDKTFLAARLLESLTYCI